MLKEEIIQLHTLFVQIKEKIERSFNDSSIFEEYEKLGISPQQVHKSKDVHKMAVFILGEAIAKFFSDGRHSEMSRVASRLARIVAKIK